MKGIVIEIKKNKAVALDSEGRFVNLKNKGYTIGEEIELNNSRNTFSYKKLAPVATAVVVVLVLAVGMILGGIYYDTNVKTAYTVQMDINPSITIYLNSKDVVIKAEGNNPDGEKLNPNELKGENLNDFLTKYIDRFVESDIYDASTEYTVKITVDGKTKATTDTKPISDKVESAVRNDFEEKGISVVTETESGVKEAEPQEGEPKEPSLSKWTYSYYNKLLSETALNTQMLDDGALILKPDCPTPGDSGYTFAFWWDGATKEDSGMPVDFFANGDRTINADTVLYAVWTKSSGYTVDGNSWLVEPTKWSFSYYNKLESDTALGVKELYDGEIIVKPDCPNTDDSGYSFAFWWDGTTKEDSAMPVDFFANGDRTITADIVLYAVWTNGNNYTTDGKTWLLEAQQYQIKYILIYPDEAGKPNEVLYEDTIETFDELKNMMPSADVIDAKIRLANVADKSFDYWSLSENGSLGNYFSEEKTLTEAVTLYAILK